MKNKKTIHVRMYVLGYVLTALLLVMLIMMYSSSRAQGYTSILQMIQSNFAGLEVSSPVESSP